MLKPFVPLFGLTVFFKTFAVWLCILISDKLITWPCCPAALAPLRDLTDLLFQDPTTIQLGFTEARFHLESSENPLYIFYKVSVKVDFKLFYPKIKPNLR